MNSHLNDRLVERAMRMGEAWAYGYLIGLRQSARPANPDRCLSIDAVRQHALDIRAVWKTMPDSMRPNSIESLAHMIAGEWTHWQRWMPYRPDRAVAAHLERRIIQALS